MKVAFFSTQTYDKERDPVHDQQLDKAGAKYVDILS